MIIYTSNKRGVLFMRTFTIDDIYLEDLINPHHLLDISKYKCLSLNKDILNKVLLEDLGQKININTSTLAIYNNWFLINNKYYYFKYHYIFEELFMEKIFATFNVPCVSHTIVKCDHKVGIISENFRKSNCKYLNYNEVISSNIDIPSHILDYNNKVSTKMTRTDYQKYLDLISKIIAIDILFGEFDHHYYNVMFEKSSSHLNLAPMFDNGDIFKDNDSDTYLFESCFDTLSFSLNSKRIDKHTIETIKYFPELFTNLESAININLNKIYNLLEQDYQLHIYKELKNQIQNYYDNHCKMVEKSLKLVKNI